MELQRITCHNNRMKIAIVGAGISGMGAAYLLVDHHDITLYEKNDYIGGHSRTIDCTIGNDKTPVDTGFIVFNDWNYPNLFGLFNALDVPCEKSDMSFGVSIHNGWLEYASGGLFAQQSNLLRRKYWGMLCDIIRFNRQAPKYIDENSSITLGQCLDELRMGEWFRHYYLLAMGAAIWSCPIEAIMQFPAKTFLRFFKNHGLLNLIKRPQWYTVKGGSREYVKRLLQSLGATVKYSAPAVKISRLPNGKVSVETADGQSEIFDEVIMACHADEALNLIDTPTQDETDILGAFKYQENKVVVHNDRSFMPQRKKCWASWVYLSETKRDEKPVVSLSYWMNNLQPLTTDEDVIVTLNPGRQPQADLVRDTHVFAHPIFDTNAIAAQDRIKDIQGKDRLWFCGAYQRYGFHEDGLLSAVNIAKAMGVKIPWE